MLRIRICSLTSATGYLSCWEFPPESADGHPRYQQEGDIPVNPGDHILVNWHGDDSTAYVILLRLPAHVHGFSELVESTRKRPHTSTSSCPACAWILDPAYVVSLWDLSHPPQPLPPGLTAQPPPVPHGILEAIAGLGP